LGVDDPLNTVFGATMVLAPASMMQNCLLALNVIERVEILGGWCYPAVPAGAQASAQIVNLFT
jgi:hypothetical protein